MASRKPVRRPTSDFAWRVGRVLRARRQSLRLSRETVAARARMTVNYLGRIERAQVNASLDTLERLVRVLQRPSARRVSRRWSATVVANIAQVRRDLEQIQAWFEREVTEP